jgi:hypothetical protein
VNRVPSDLTRVLEAVQDDAVPARPHRFDPASSAPPPPHSPAAGAQVTVAQDREVAASHARNS